MKSYSTLPPTLRLSSQPSPSTKVRYSPFHESAPLQPFLPLASFQAFGGLSHLRHVEFQIAELNNNSCHSIFDFIFTIAPDYLIMVVNVEKYLDSGIQFTNSAAWFALERPVCLGGVVFVHLKASETEISFKSRSNIVQSVFSDLNRKRRLEVEVCMRYFHVQISNVLRIFFYRRLYRMSQNYSHYSY